METFKKGMRIKLQRVPSNSKIRRFWELVKATIWKLRKWHCSINLLNRHKFPYLHAVAKKMRTIFPHIRPEGIIVILHSLQMRVLLENTAFSLHKITRIAGIIRGKALYEEIR